LTIVQPGHAGNGIEFTNESLSSISISISFLSIWWTAFHKIEIDSHGTFARVAAAGANQPAQPSPYNRCARNTNGCSRRSLTAAISSFFNFYFLLARGRHLRTRCKYASYSSPKVRRNVGSSYNTTNR
jgi:hypothetical protein